MSLASVTAVTADAIEEGRQVEDVELLREALTIALLGVAELSRGEDADETACEVLSGVHRVLSAA